MTTRASGSDDADALRARVLNSKWRSMSLREVLESISSIGTLGWTATTMRLGSTLDTGTGRRAAKGIAGIAPIMISTPSEPTNERIVRRINENVTVAFAAKIRKPTA